MSNEVVTSYNRYGKQQDILTNCRIRYSKDSDSIRLFFKGSVKPIYIGKNTSAYKSLKALFPDVRGEGGCEERY